MFPWLSIAFILLNSLANFQLGFIHRPPSLETLPVVPSNVPDLHEPQCLEKWNTANNQLPGCLKRPETRRPGTVCSKAATQRVTTK
uniref:Secreted protein n=1 Tax=Coturnix japonica TaxID=93934 RepID=A0A8C2T2B8_COTJA